MTTTSIRPLSDGADPALEPVLALLADAERADGAGPLSEQAELALRNHRGRGVHLLAEQDGQVVGYAQVSAGGSSTEQPAVLEGAVHPSRRRSGVGTALLAAAREAAAGPVLVWAHGGSEGTRAFLTAAGGTRVRRLLQMRRELDPLTVPIATLPPGIRVRPFEIGKDEDAFLALNAVVFASHPEQGSMTRTDLEDRIAEPWFDPAGFLLAEDTTTGTLLGFHWTKVHPAGDDSPAFGEVYVVGVAPQGQGHGLGRTLVVAGLAHLASPAASTAGPMESAVLYVEADNASALAVYTGLRFTVAHVDEQYRID